jgi:hypothetical protein
MKCKVVILLTIIFLIAGCQKKGSQPESIIHDPMYPSMCRVIYPDMTLPDSLGGASIKGWIYLFAHVKRNGELIGFDITRMELWEDTSKSEIVYSLIPGEENYKNYEKLNKYYPWIVTYMQHMKYIPDTTNELLKSLDTIIVQTTIVLPKAPKKKVDL